MKKVKKILILLLIVIVAIQVPFIYRRWKLGQIAAKIATAEQGRVVRTGDNFDEYVGVIHAHTSLGGHSTGAFDELVSGANQAGLDFVLMTEHWSDEYNTAALTLNGKYGRTLFVGGNEIDTADADRFLMLPGSGDAAGLRWSPTDAVLTKLHSEQRLALITYPEKYNSWNAAFDGIEVFSLNTAAKAINKFTGPFDVIWSGRAYPELTFAQYFRRPDANLARFDEVSQKRPISLFAGTDAHSNIGFHLFGDDAGHKVIGLKLDPYKFSFSIARVHLVLAKGSELTTEKILYAIKNNRFFTGIDALGDTSGFRFDAYSTFGADGAPVPVQASLQVRTPLPSKVVIYKNGTVFNEQGAVTDVNVPADGPGVYRVEVYREDLGEPFSKMPWIMSSPIYVR